MQNDLIGVHNFFSFVVKNRIYNRTPDFNN